VKYIAALLLALALFAVPGLAFVPTIPVSDLEKITTPMTSDYGTYTYTRVAVDAGNTNTEPFTPQHVYSGILFGADEANIFAPFGDEDSYTAGVVANDMSTTALVYVDNPDFDDQLPESADNPRQILVEGVATDTTRQFIQQAGKAWLTQNPIGSDAENTVGYSTDMGFEKSQVAWISSKMDAFVATPASQAAVGGNFLESVPNVLSPACQNAWLIEKEDTADETPITVIANGDADLKEAFAGIKSTSELKLYPAGASSAGTPYPADALMSGYTERFAGYNDASIAANAAWTNGVNPATTETYTDNEIVMDVGTTPVENFWITYEGVEFDAPNADDFPDNDPSSDYFGWVTWPDDTPKNEL
jgi:hypothetical protein